VTALESQSIKSYLQALASGEPTPGGGAAAALTAAQGAALLAMVCNLTIGKAKFAQFETELRSILHAAEQAYMAMLGQAEKDMAAFENVMAAYRSPKTTEQEATVRSAQIQSALKASAEVPFNLYKMCLSMFPLADRLEKICSPSVLSDVIVGRHLLQAALLSAQANIEQNLLSITNGAFCQSMRAAIDEMKIKI
jgi:formiminotetrahydrofolate cyclodeaminase